MGVFLNSDILKFLYEKDRSIIRLVSDPKTDITKVSKDT